MTVETRVQQIQVLSLMEPDPKGAGTKNRRTNQRNYPGSECTWGLCVVGQQYGNSVCRSAWGEPGEPSSASGLARAH